MENRNDKQEGHEADPEVENTISTDKKENVMFKADGDETSATTTTANAAGGWSRATTMLVLAVVVLVATLVVVVPVLLTRSNKRQKQSTSSSTLATNEKSKSLLDAADRQGPLFPSPMTSVPVSIKPPAPSGSSLPSFLPSFMMTAAGTLPPDLQPDTNNRCGVNTLDAYGNCGNECTTQADCAEGEFCWGTFLNYCRIMPEGHPQCELWNGEQTKRRCGYDEASARGYCGNECTDITECGPAEFCFPVQLNFCDCFEAQDANTTATSGRDLLAGPDGTMTNAEYFDEAVLVISPYFVDAASGSLFSRAPSTIAPVVFGPVAITECPECPLGCGKLTANSSETICCEKFATSIFNGTDFEAYCAFSLPLGESCLDSQQCESFYICVNGKCAESRLPPGSTCSTNDDCDTYQCGFLSLNATNEVCCPNSLFGFVGVIQIWDDATQSYVSYCPGTVETGQPCLVDEVCKSGICINETLSNQGVCRDERLPGGSVCQRDSNCQNGYCGFTEFGPVDSNKTKICCPGGRGAYAAFEPFYEPNYYCARIIPVGDPCEADTGNALCKTGICVQGFCTAERLPNGVDCEQPSDCKSNACAYDSLNWTSRKLICCRNTLGVFDGSFYDEYCVQSIPTGESCDPLVGRRNLALNGTINKNQFPVAAPFVGVPVNLFPVSSPVNRFPSAPVNRFPSAPVNRFPVSSPVNRFPVSSPVNRGSQNLSPLCKSGLCAGGTCAEERLAANETCDNDSECASLSCALPFYDPNAQDKICCAGSNYFICESFGCDKYCKGTVPNGGACPRMDGSRVCQSGICVDGVCSGELLADGSLCTLSELCSSGACGFDSVPQTSRQSICCTSGDLLFLYDRFDYNPYCSRSVPVGGKCLSGTADLNNANGFQASRMCESGICVDGVCASSRLQDKAPCTSDNDCESGACGFNSLDFDSREKVCCNATCSAQLYDGFSYDSYCVGIQSVGDSCSVWDRAGPKDEVHPELCSTGICIDNICASELIGINETCTASTDCVSGACGFTSTDTTSGKTCCEYFGYTSSIFDGICGYDEFCVGTFPSGAACGIHGSSYSALCQSFQCEAGICVENNGTVVFSEAMIHDPPSSAPIAMPVVGSGGGANTTRVVRKP